MFRQGKVFAVCDNMGDKDKNIDMEEQYCIRTGGVDFSVKSGISEKNEIQVSSRKEYELKNLYEQRKKKIIGSYTNRKSFSFLTSDQI